MRPDMRREQSDVYRNKNAVFTRLDMRRVQEENHRREKSEIF